MLNNMAPLGAYKYSLGGIADIHKTQADTNVCPIAEEDTVVGLYDFPPDDVRSREYVSGRRQSRSTERNKEYTESLYTYVDETLDHEGLVQYAQKEFGVDGRGCDTQTIIRKLQFAKEQQATEMGSTRRPPSIIMVDSTPLQVGGGWSQEVIHPMPDAASSQMPGPHPSGSSSGSSNRQCTITVADIATEVEDTATEPETEDELNNPPGNRPRVSRERISQVILRTGGTDRSLGHTHLSQPDTTAPPPSRNSTPPTVIDIQSSNPPFRSHSLGGSLSRYGVSLPPEIEEEPERTRRSLPCATALPRNPTHTRLNGELIDRYIDATERAVIVAEDSQSPTPGPNDGTLLEEVPETDLGSPPRASLSDSRANRRSTNSQRTYSRTQRSHLAAGLNTTSTAPILNHVSTPAAKANANVDDTTEDEDADQATSQSLTPSQLIRRERARAVTAKAREEMAQLSSRGRRRARVFAKANTLPTSRPQERPPPGGKGNALGQRTGGTRRLDPVSAARSDMLAFNRAVARGEATSLVESVTRQTDELLDDNEELLAQAEAYANSRWPTTNSSSRSRHRIYKQKPLARDVSGLERQVLIMAKVHLFAYSLVEGIYQTRATFLRWASAVHISTWQMDLPDRPYEKPSNEIFEIMVNNIATLRGKVKERLREFVAVVTGFQQNLSNQRVIQQNLDLFNRVYPNTFHCKNYNPRHGDYEHPDIGRCIALAFFHGPGAVGTMYPDYFRDMPITVVAFALAMWQFCIEEWANGWRQNGDLGMAAMREKYEAQLSGLKELRRIAPRRLNRLQEEWRDYVAEYSGAVFVPEEELNAEPSPPSGIRPDTPEPNDDAISVDEMNERLLETGRQESLRDRMQEIASLELAAPMDLDDERCSSVSGSRPASPIQPEYNAHGVRTARSNGKGRAN
ncbi:unnamed protein product [Rhizoctonia solani]|uniref:DUF6532 domain-containing protein n=1 Tax=Rhizoctonia solani TaxID=456999 RepID=A0A8H3AHL1_9AGAM|nr:unnamed protein product [Rhizoctonia solani]